MSKDTSQSKGNSRAPAPDDPHHLAMIYLRRRCLTAPSGDCLRFWRGQLWRWNGRRYEKVSEPELRAEVTKAVQHEFDRLGAAASTITSTGDEKPKPPRKVTRSLISNVIQSLQAITLLADAFEAPGWLDRPGKAPTGPQVALVNGLVDLDGLLAGRSSLLRPHTSRWFSEICLDYAYNPCASCPQWIAFLRWAMEGDEERIALIQEWFGYLVTHDTSMQRFLVLVGEGANGKTVVLVVLTALLGKDNVSHVPLELFGNRFQLARTLGKLANIAPEVGDMDRLAEGVLKSFVSGDRMHFDRKFQEGIEARPTARAVFSTNSLPRFADRSEGIWRRLSVIPFRVSVPPEKQDPHLADKLIAELPGIFNWAIEGLRRLRDRGQFTEPAVSVQAREEHRTDSNSARAFLLDETVTRARASTKCQDLYARYVGWCESNGRRQLDAAQFGKEVLRLYPTVNRRRMSGPGMARPWVYEGLTLKGSPIVVPRPTPAPARAGQPSPVSRVS